MLLLPLLFLLPLFTGFLLVRLLLPSHPFGKGRLWLEISLGWGLGTGITSLLSFYWLLLFNAWNQGLFLTEIGIFLLVFLLSLLPHKKGGQHTPSPPWPIHPLDLSSRLLALLFGLFFIYALVMFFFLLYTHPHGRWDAWYIWNLRARFLFRGHQYWKSAFSPGLHHADYPPLLPFAVARTWYHLKREAVLVPGLVALFFLLATAGLLVSVFTLIKRPSRGYWAGLILLATPFFLFLAADQIADNPLAYYFLAVLISFFLYDKKSGTGFLAVAGIMAGLAGWTKNEGLLFILALPLSRCFVSGQNWKTYGITMGWFLLGLLPILSTILFFKWQVAPPNDLWGPQTLSTLFGKLMEGERYTQIGKAFWKTFYAFGYWPVLKLNPLLLLFGMIYGYSWSRIRGDLLPAFLVLGIMLCGYFMVFVLSPHDLNWHLRTATDRLFLHFWPSLLFLFFASLRSPSAKGR